MQSCPRFFLSSSATFLPFLLSLFHSFLWFFLLSVL
jgi:hypothetical protein